METEELVALLAEHRAQTVRSLDERLDTRMVEFEKFQESLPEELSAEIARMTEAHFAAPAPSDWSWVDVESARQHHRRCRLYTGTAHVTRMYANESQRQGGAAGDTAPATGRAIRDPWIQRFPGDPWLRAGADQYEATSGIVISAEAAVGEFVKETSAPLPGAASAARTTAGNATAIGPENQRYLANYINLSVISRAVQADVQSIENRYRLLYQRRWSQMRGKATFAAIKAAANIADVKTGQAATLPTAENLAAKMLAMVAEVEDYVGDGGAWVMSPALWALYMQIRSDATSGFAIDPTTGAMTAYGYPIIKSTVLDAGNTANDISGVFGDFLDGVVQAEDGDLMVESYSETVPGALTLFAAGRFEGFVENTHAICRFKTAA